MLGAERHLPPSLQYCIECDVLQRFYATLNSSIVDPDLFAAHLIQNGFTTRQTADNKMQGFSDYCKVGHLLGVVDAHIKTACVVSHEHVRSRFDVFLSILGNVLGHQAIAQQMADQCCMFITYCHDKNSSYQFFTQMAHNQKLNLKYQKEFHKVIVKMYA